ncbi:succinate dehydrogenase/fumarate reductase iron-sulfur subunit, partial [Verrucomicrobiales bacterium]|nr:succinate dehydrogenase/fumarate reductase iron-sulfur subunit [Verrucomicrobiales bacterium]
MATEKLNLTLKVWRQSNAEAQGRIETYDAKDIPTTASFLEMLDIVNEDIIESGGEPVVFDHDCREGICGSCSLTINGRPHGPGNGVTTCQLHMRSFKDGDTIWVEPFRADAFPVLKDLMVNRSAFDRIIQAGGFISARTGSAVDANATPIPKPVADSAFDAAACIGCGACVAACKNASAMLFVAAKVEHLAMLPQGKAEKNR